mgnify:CR=1 FL=1|tara:strand:+ start:83 stop:217 length:135 start_codon:yes stop_codon:yes gene_type:complete
MIKEIVSLLKIVNNESENIKIAKGKYKLASNWKEAYKQIKELWE